VADLSDQTDQAARDLGAGAQVRARDQLRQASVSDEVGILCLEIEGAPKEVESGLRWLKKLGVSVEPVEMNAIAS